MAALQSRADGQPNAAAPASRWCRSNPSSPPLRRRHSCRGSRSWARGPPTTSPALSTATASTSRSRRRTINGYVVQPGERFDFLTAIGDITSPPYVEGGVLIHGQIKEDGAIGGGMCSCSTTLFNAALRAGLQIDARGNHSIYISRYPVGLDATVWMSGGSRRTMAFTNDTGYPILIKGINERGKVTFELYGIDDGRTVEIQDPRVENIVEAGAWYRVHRRSGARRQEASAGRLRLVRLMGDAHRPRRAGQRDPRGHVRFALQEARRDHAGRPLLRRSARGHSHPTRGLPPGRRPATAATRRARRELTRPSS